MHEQSRWTLGRPAGAQPREREQPYRFLIHDRDNKFGAAFDEVFRSKGVAVIRTPIQAANANAHAERWVRTVRHECLDRILTFSRRQLEHVLHVYVDHCNRHRPHRSLQLRPRTAGAHSPPSIQQSPSSVFGGEISSTNYVRRARISQFELSCQTKDLRHPEGASIRPHAKNLGFAAESSF